MSYFRWPIDYNVTFFLELVGSDGSGVTGADPKIIVRRYRNPSTLLDNYYWNNSGAFVATALSHSMQEVDSTNNPGLYSYYFSQSLLQTETTYNVYYKNGGTPLGFATERHSFLSGSTESVVRVYESEID